MLNRALVTIPIGTHRVPLLVWDDKPVTTLARVDELPEHTEGTALRTFDRYKHHFTKGEDYYSLTAPQVAQMYQECGYEGERNQTGQVVRISPRGMTVLTKYGYLLLVKPFRDDLFWAIQEELADEYFDASPAS